MALQAKLNGVVGFACTSESPICAAGYSYPRERTALVTSIWGHSTEPVLLTRLRGAWAIFTHLAHLVQAYK